MRPRAFKELTQSRILQSSNNNFSFAPSPPAPEYYRSYTQILTTFDPIPARVWEGISPSLYYTFWTLDLGDIVFPGERYKAEQAKLQQSVRHLEDELRKNRQLTPPEVDNLQKQRKKEITVLEGLPGEARTQAARVRIVLERLKEESKGWITRSEFLLTNGFIMFLIFNDSLL